MAGREIKIPPPPEGFEIVEEREMTDLEKHGPQPRKLPISPTNGQRLEKWDIENKEEAEFQKGRADAQEWLNYMQTPPPPPGFVIDGSKSITTAVKHGLERGGVGMVNAGVGLARMERDIGGNFRDWFWGSQVGEALGGKPEFTKRMEDGLEEWERDMRAGVAEYYRTNKHKDIAFDEELGFVETTKDILMNPEKLVQTVTESVPLMLEAALGTVLAGPGGGIMVMSQPKAGEIYESSRGEGTNVLPALFQAQLTGTAEAAIEQWSFGKKLGLAKGFSQMMNKGGKKIMWEGLKAYGRGSLQEGSQTFNENLWRYVFTDRSQSLSEGVLQSAAIGGPIEVVMSGAFAAGGKTMGAAKNMMSKEKQQGVIGSFRENVNENESLSDESKAELNEEFDRVDADIEAGLYEDPTLEQAAAEEYESLFDTELNEDAETNRQTADAIVEGQEVEAGSEAIADADVRTDAEVSIDKLNDALETRAIPEARELTEQQRSAETGKRVAKAVEARAKVLKEGGTAKEAQHAAMAQMRGEMEKAGFPQFSSDEMGVKDFENVRHAILDSKLKFFEEQHAMEALNKLQEGMVPTESEMRDLGKVIGKKNVDALLDASRGVKGKVYDFFVNLVNFPTTTLASSEISMIGRQGITTLTKWPKQWFKALGSSYKSFFNDSWAKAKQTEMETSKNFDKFIDSGGEFTEMDGAVTKQDERFQSSWAKQIPYFGALVRASERSAVVGMNSLRLSIFSKYAEDWVGQNMPESEYGKLAEIVNISTGRGQITNKRIQAILPFLNAAFFSPRYVISRFQMVGKGGKAIVDIATGKATPTSKIMASELVNFVAAGSMVMFLASMIPGVKVEKDPRSSDFGKIQLGRMRVDVWGGFQQIARTATQIATGTTKATSSGELFNKSRLETFGRFVQSKLSPGASLGVEVLSGKDFLGRPLPEFESEAEFLEYAIGQKLAPLIFQDTIDAIRYSENKGAMALAYPLAFHGVGVQTFEKTPLDDLSEVRDFYSNEVFGKNWEDMGPASQEALREFKPQIGQQEEVAKFERRNAIFDVKRQREAGLKVEKSLPPEVLKEMTANNVTLGGLSRTITRKWRLNAKLYQQYQDDLSNVLTKAMPKVINNRSYQQQPPEAKQIILDKVLKEAKAAVRKRIVRDANKRDLEDIQKGRANAE